MKILIAAILVVAAAVAGFLGGRLPEHQRRTEVEAKLLTTEKDLASARELLELHGLFDRIQGLVEITSDTPRYDDALELSSSFFDLVRKQQASATDATVRDALASALSVRDAVTAGLARHDPGVRALLVRIRDTLHPLVVPSDEEPATLSKGTAMDEPAQ
jgi:hypothetical protein